MMQDLMRDAIVNLVKKAATASKGLLVQGLQDISNSNSDGYTSSVYNQQAMLQSDWINPKDFWVTFKEIVRYHMYNVSNSTAYLTIIIKRPKKSMSNNLIGFQRILEIFPATYTYTPLRGANTDATMVYGGGGNGGTLFQFGWPDWFSSGNADPFAPTNGSGANAICYMPRAYGAYEARFPYLPNIGFTQANVQNFFNRGSGMGTNSDINGSNLVLTAAPSAVAPYALDAQTNVKSNVAGVPYFNTGSTGVQGEWYVPGVAQAYFHNTQQEVPSSAGPGGAVFLATPAYTGVNFAPSNRNLTSTYANLTRSTQVQSVSDNTGSTGAYQDDPAGNIFPTGVQPGGNVGAFGADDWSKQTQYDEMKNRCMRVLFKMRKRRITIPPGKVFRWTLRSKRATINPVRDGLVIQVPANLTNASQPVFASNIPNSTGAGPVASEWGYANSTQKTTLSPGMWGPGMPCKTTFWSCSIRGQTAQSNQTTNIATTLTPSVLLKKDHSIRYNVKHTPTRYRALTHHETIRNYMSGDNTSADFTIQYPIAGVISGGSAATSNSAAQAVAIK